MDIRCVLHPKRRAITCTITTTFLVRKMRFAESQKRRIAIAHIAEKNEEPRLRLIEFWLASIWPDSLIPEEMRLPSLMAFHEKHQTISSSEMAERVLMLDLHPLINTSHLKGS